MFAIQCISSPITNYNRHLVVFHRTTWGGIITKMLHRRVKYLSSRSDILIRPPPVFCRSTWRWWNRGRRSWVTWRTSGRGRTTTATSQRSRPSSLTPARSHGNPGVMSSEAPSYSRPAQGHVKLANLISISLLLQVFEYKIACLAMVEGGNWNMLFCIQLPTPRTKHLFSITTFCLRWCVDMIAGGGVGRCLNDGAPEYVTQFRFLKLRSTPLDVHVH